MLRPLTQQIEETVLVVKEGPSTKRIQWPENLHATFVNSKSQLISLVEQSQNEGKRILLLIEEFDYSEVLEEIRQFLLQRPGHPIGIVAMSAKPEEFFLTHSADPELLDTVAPSSLKKYSAYVLSKVMRQLIRKEERELRKLGHKTLERLNRIFIKLSAERKTENLLSSILSEAIQLSNASGGTLYVAEEIDGEVFFTLRIVNSGQLSTVRMEQVKIKVQENSICGYVVLTGKPLNLPDVQSLPPHMLPQLQVSVDHGFETETKSVLTLPLKNSRNEVIAILQLVNKVHGNIVAFENEDESLLSSLATQAAICLENVELYADIQKLFDGFVKASITAIESRDPSTAGHSERVAKMTVLLAQATTDCSSGVYRSVRFSSQEMRELEYAALLHDFGKIGVREEVLVKAKKLFPYQMTAIKDRIAVCRSALFLGYLQKKQKGGVSPAQLEAEYHEKVARLEKIWEIIKAAQEPTILDQEVAEQLAQIRTDNLGFPEGFKIQILTEEELAALSIPKGSLTPSERLEVESHVRHTYQFLKLIHWTKDFKKLPDIAHGHHEKLDGSGYPRGLLAHEIPLQSKIMTIADIYDALTAADRWYKDAVPVERALDILGQEVNQGKIDPILFDIFLERRIYEIVEPTKRHRHSG